MQGAAAYDLRVVVPFRDPELLDVLVKRHHGFVEQDALADVDVEEAAYGKHIAGAGPPHGQGIRGDFGAVC